MNTHATWRRNTTKWSPGSTATRLRFRNKIKEYYSATQIYINLRNCALSQEKYCPYLLSDITISIFQRVRAYTISDEKILAFTVHRTLNKNVIEIRSNRLTSRWKPPSNGNHRLVWHDQNARKRWGFALVSFRGLNSSLHLCWQLTLFINSSSKSPKSLTSESSFSAGSKRNLARKGSYCSISRFTQ